MMQAIEKTIEELKKSIEDLFEKQKVLLREIIREIPSAFFDSLKLI